MNRPLREGFVSVEGGGNQQPPPQAVARAPAPAADAAAKPPDKPEFFPTQAPEIEPSPAEQTPDFLVDKWPITVKLLNKPIRDNSGKEIHELVLREPRAGDIGRNGNPIRVNQDGDWLIDERKMTFMIATLSNILPPLIDTMDTRDWNSVAYRLRRFFLPDAAAW